MSESATETFVFQAEINQLLSLIINTFYSNKEVFLRELISNASDALDKVRYQSLTDATVLGDTPDLHIQLTLDSAARTLTIQDTGVGMTRDELIRNLGTIAHSGTRAFMEALKEGASAAAGPSLIGQFGVGFYAAFLVAERVQVFSRHVSSPDVHVWESNASGSFTVSHAPETATMPRGTKIVLYLKEDQAEYAQEPRIRDVVRKHSQYASFPIQLWVEKEVPAREEDAKTASSDEEAEAEGKVEEAEPEAETKSPKTVKTQEWERLNTQAPIWSRPSEEVTPEEYNTFYKSISNDWEDPLTHKHFTVDGSVQFKALLYVPRRAPFDMFTTPDRKRSNIKLYVRKVLILEETNDLMPEYLGFIQGVVDSDDLPLNVSREMLQQSNILNVIKRNLVKKAIDMLATLHQDPDNAAWKTFYEAFAKNLKIGIHEDAKNREKLADLLQYVTSKTEEVAPISLATYVERMPEAQKDIYFIAGPQLKALQSSPLTAKLTRKGFEVLFFTDTMDEYMVQQLREYKGKKLTNISRDGLELPVTDEEKESHEALTKEWEPICKQIHNILGSDHITQVRVSPAGDLLDTPCVLVSDRYGWTANMERIMKAQTLQNTSMGGAMMMRKILEINPTHPLLTEIRQRLQAAREPTAPVKSLVHLLYQTVLLDSGFTLEEPSRYAAHIYKILQAGFSGEDPDASTEAHEENENLTPTPTSPLEELD